MTRLMCTLHRRHTSKCDGKTHSSETCHANDLLCVMSAVTIRTIAIKSWMHQQKLPHRILFHSLPGKLLECTRAHHQKSVIDAAAGGARR